MKKIKLVGPGIFLVLILGAIPACLGVVYGVPFQLSASPTIGQILISVVWLLWLVNVAVFLLELGAVFWGFSVPLFLPTLQRPLGRIINSSFVLSMARGDTKLDAFNSKRPLELSNSSSLLSKKVSDPTLNVGTGLLVQDPASRTSKNNGVKMQNVEDGHPRQSRVLLTKVLLAASASLDSKLRNREQPQILGICLGTDRVKVVLDKALDPPEGFKISGGGNIWEMEIDRVNNFPEPKAGDMVLPLFVPLGYLSGSSRFYLNLEKANKVTVLGDHIEILDFLEKIILDLVCDDLNSDLRIFCVGLNYELAENHKIMVVERLGDILPAIEKQASRVGAISKPESVFERSYSPVLVVDPFVDNAELIKRLELSCGKGIASILSYGKGDWSLDISKSEVNLSPAGLRLSRFPKKNGYAKKEDISKLKAELGSMVKHQNNGSGNKKVASAINHKNFAAQKLVQKPAQKPAQESAQKVNSKPIANQLPNPMSNLVSSPMSIPAPINPTPIKEKESSPSRPPLAEVQLMGSIRVRNAVEPFSSLQSLSLVCYLAAHRDGASSDQLMRWIWPPDEPPTRQIFANVVSRARRCLGNKSDGSSYILYESGIYRLSKEIVSDFEIFRAEVKKADFAKDDTQVLEFLKTAILQIKGVPFTVGGAKAFQWADNTFRAELEYLIDTTVHRLASLAIKTGNLDLARFAINKGLMCIPGCEQCLARLLIVAAKSKNTGALIEAKSDIESSYEALGYKIPGSLLNIFNQLYSKIKDQSMPEISRELKDID